MTEHPFLQQEGASSSNTRSGSVSCIVSGGCSNNMISTATNRGNTIFIRPSLRNKTNREPRNRSVLTSPSIHSSSTSTSTTSPASSVVVCAHLETDSLDQELNRPSTNRNPSDPSSVRGSSSNAGAVIIVRDLVVERQSNSSDNNSNKNGRNPTKSSTSIQPSQKDFRTLIATAMSENAAAAAARTSSASSDSTSNTGMTQNHPSDNNQINIQTHLEFACMSKQEYEDSQQVHQKEEENPAMSTDEKHDSLECQRQQTYPEDPNYYHHYDDDDDQKLEEESDDDKDDQHMLKEPYTLTPFMKLWKILSQWMTHDTLNLFNTWNKDDEILQSCIHLDQILYPTINYTSDAAATPDNELLIHTQQQSPPSQQQQQLNQCNQCTTVSARYQGLMAMLKIHMPTCVEILGLLQSNQDQSLGTYKLIEERVGAFVSTFDLYSTDMTYTSMYLHTSNLWRLCTMILVEMTCFDHHPRQEKEPTELDLHKANMIQDLGLSMDEYTYLTNHTLQSLCIQYATNCDSPST